MARFVRVLLYLVLAYFAVLGLQLAVGSMTVLGVVIGFAMLAGVVLAVVALRRRRQGLRAATE